MADPQRVVRTFKPGPAKNTDEACEHEIRVLAGYLRLLHKKRFFGSITLKFEDGLVVKGDQNTSVRLVDMEAIMRHEADLNKQP